MNRSFLYVTVFLTGMVVMAVELTASRLLAPYFGASLFVWTNIIGVVLAAISLGYYIGGKLADRHKGEIAQKALYPIILVTGILVTLIPLIGRPIFLFAYQAIPDRVASIFFSSLIATLILFTIPFILIGMVIPLVTKISLKKLDQAGSTVGSIYAISTLGSIVGTFLPVILTIPFLGSRETFFLFGGLLILLGVVGMRRVILSGFIALPLLLFLLPGNIHANEYLEFEGESIYNYIRVHRAPDGSRALLTNEGEGIQSLYHPTRYMTGYYWDSALFLPLMNPNGNDFLIVGTAGASSARILNHFFPYLNLSGVEIDPLMVEVANKYFGADKIPFPVALDDGRVFLAKNEKRYDFIMVDVYKDELYIPFHLATEEFFTLVKNRLTEEGSMMMNVAATSNSEMLYLIKNTIAKAFPYVYEWRTEDSYNSLIFGFKSEPNFDALPLSSLSLELRTLAGNIRRNIHRIQYDPKQQISDDNRSPLEYLTEKMVVSEVVN